MPSKDVTYICNICGSKFRDYDKAEECEKAHKIPIGVDTAKYEDKKYDRKSDYPLSVLVHFKDNTSARYFRK